MSKIGFRRASVYKHSLSLNILIMREFEVGLLVRDADNLRRSCYKLVSNIASALSSHYPNDTLKKLNRAVNHLKKIEGYLDLANPHSGLNEEIHNIALQIKKLLKVHMKNVWN